MTILRKMDPSEELLAEPRQCAVYPGRSKDPEGFIDTGNILPGWDGHVYISITAVKEMGRTVGMVDRSVVEEAQVQIAQAKADCERALEEVERLRPVEEALGRAANNVTPIKPESTPDPDPIAA